jgi:hypothetical protein
MASSYTLNLGIEQPATGDQSGAWGGTVNVNMDILDQTTNGIVDVTLVAVGTTGSPNALDISNGAVSDGRNAFINVIDGGDLGGDVYIQIAKNTAEKICHIRNGLTTQNLIVFQGTYNAARFYTIYNGNTALLKFGGEGAAATTTAVVSNSQIEGKIAWENNAKDDEISIGTDSNDDINVTVNGVVEATFDSSASAWDLKTNQIISEASLTLKERGASFADVAAYGQIWVKSTVPATLWYTDDAGTDVQLGTSGVLGTKGDLYGYSTSATAVSVGADGEVLTANDAAADGSGVEWAANPAGFADPMTTRGDVIYRALGGTTRLGIGSNGYVLTSDGTDVSWAAPTGGSGSTFLALTDTPSNYSGDSGKYLTVSGSTVVFTTFPTRVSSVSAVAPIVSSGGTTPQITINPASGSNAGSMSLADYSKLFAVEAGAEVTSNAKVNAAGAVMESDYSGKTGMLIVNSIAPGYVARSLASGNANITVADANGVDGNPTVTLAATLASMTAATFSGTVTAGGFASTSARDKKTIVSDFLNYRGDNVLYLMPYVYYLNDDKAQVRQLGYIADEVATLFPEVVMFDGEGTETGLDYSRLIIPAIEKIKSQENRIARLEGLVEQLLNREI